MARKSKFLIGMVGFAALATIGATTAAVLLTNQNPQSTISKVNSPLNPLIETGKNNLSNSSLAKGFGMKLEEIKTTNLAEEKYLLTIENNNKKEGAIFFMTEVERGKFVVGDYAQQIEIYPGREFRVGVMLNEGYENYTVRDLKVSGVEPNHFVPSKQVEGETNVFSVKLPAYPETVNPITNKSWLYGENVPITVVPSFIVAALTEDTKWEHGAYFDSLNGYVYNLTKDSNWSEVKDLVYDRLEENVDKESPIDLYFFLNGYTLTFDEAIEAPKGISSGWAMRFYNNKYEDNKNGYGEIRVAEGVEAILPVEGSVAFGYNVKFKYLIRSGSRIQFLNYEDQEWIGYIAHDPAENK